MIYYSDEARNSALENIQRLQVVIASIPGDKLSFSDSQALGHYLGVLADAIKGEQFREAKINGKL